MKKIGRLKKVNIRDLWQGEASEFTPWLAKEENVDLLSETIGIELEVISEEKSVGPFRADVLCKNTLDDSYVLIENQLEKTDHNHLGQIMTYAAGLEAVTIIWISREFTEEHRAAMDWLNRITNETIRFFGIEVEAYRIADSLPAPLFQVISQPNDWAKAVKDTSRKTELTPAKSLNLEYWTSMKEYFENNGAKLRSQKPLPQHWTNFAIGRSNFHMAAVSSVRDNFIRVEFLINGEEAKNRFDILKEKFEDESRVKIDKDIQWEKLEERKVSWVYIQKSADVNDKNDWSHQFDWFLEKLEKMDSFFRPKIKILK